MCVCESEENECLWTYLCAYVNKISPSRFIYTKRKFLSKFRQKKIPSSNFNVQEYYNKIEVLNILMF